jgi:ADP-heptose:LPS heptosyltransferase
MVQRENEARRAAAEPLASHPGRVALFRALQLGDLLCAVPAFRALRAAWPHATLTFVGLPWAREIVERLHRYLDDFLEFPGHPALPERAADLQAWPTFLERAHARRFDLAIQMHGAGTLTNPLAAMLGAERLAGYHRPGEYCPSPDTFLAYPEHGPEVRRHLALVARLGVRPAGEQLEFPLRPDDFHELHRIVALEPGTYACLHPGGKARSRRWPPDRFTAVARHVLSRGLTPVLTGTDPERELTAAIAAGLRGRAVDLAGRTTLGALGALLAGARLLVSNDTGVAHLADAIGTASITLFAETELERWAALDRDRHRALTPVRSLSVARVTSEVDGLLGAALSPACREVA